MNCDWYFFEREETDECEILITKRVTNLILELIKIWYNSFYIKFCWKWLDVHTAQLNFSACILHAKKTQFYYIIYMNMCSLIRNTKKKMLRFYKFDTFPLMCTFFLYLSSLFRVLFPIKYIWFVKSI